MDKETLGEMYAEKYGLSKAAGKEVVDTFTEFLGDYIRSMETEEKLILTNFGKFYRKKRNPRKVYDRVKKVVEVKEIKDEMKFTLFPSYTSGGEETIRELRDKYQDSSDRRADRHARAYNKLMKKREEEKAKRIIDASLDEMRELAIKDEEEDDLDFYE